MATEVDVCNTALGFIGEAHISSLSDPTKRATHCALVYPEARDAALRAHKWPFATRRANLALDTTAPVYGYDNAFVLPTDYIRFHSRKEWSFPYSIEGKRLLCDLSVFKCRIIYRHKSVEDWPASFRNIVALKMASQLAISLADNQNLEAKYTNKYTKRLQEAREETSAEYTPDDDESPAEDSWIAARN